MLLALLTLFSANVFAASYNLSIASVQVNDANKNDILGDGKVTYDSESNTLTLDNATINATVALDGIENKIPNLTINLIGENIINVGYYGLDLWKNTIITGSGSLTINSNYRGIYLYYCNLTIENTTVTAVGESRGICGDGNNEVLTITNSTVRATGTNDGSIADINNLVLNGCAIAQPAGAVFNSSQKAVCVNGEIVTAGVIIEPPVSYNLYVAGVQVNYANKYDITSAVVAAGKTASGIITYDPTSNTLTLNNATIDLSTNNDLRAIQSYISDLSIELIGVNNVTAKYHSITFEEADATITGTGSLNVTSTSKTAIYPANCNLTILNTTVTATGSAYGIRGAESSNKNIYIINSILSATGTDGGSIRYINDLVLNGCAITQPTGAMFNASQKGVCLNGTLVKTEIVIEPVYDLYIAGVQVTGTNKDDITSAVVAAGQTASGTITFNPTSNTLTLNNANFSTSAIGINNSIENLTINLIGENSIAASGHGIYSNYADFTITGTGSLTINANNGIYLEECNLNIENTTVTAIGSDYGIGGYYGNSGNLTINNSTVRATGTNDGSIANINNLVLNGCAIVQPTGAVFNASQKAVCLNGEIVTTEVLIVPAYDLWVAGVRVTDVNKTNITGTGISGSVSYNSESNTLTLDNASINATDDGIHNYIPNLRINLLGENTITANYDGIYSFQADFTITGSGSLYAATINGSGIYQYQSNLTIENTTITANGNAYGILGNSDSSVLTITNSTVRATGTNGGSIANINTLVLNGCAITQPTGAMFNASQKGVCLNGTLVKTEIVIEPVYDLYIAGVQVTGTNKDDITSAVVAAGQTASGTITYNPTTNTLTFDNANISSSSDRVISNDIPNLRINLIGENSITASNYGIYSYEADFTIIGNGSLIINADHSGIYHNYCNLTIENTTVTANGQWYGIRGNSGNNEVLSITNSTVRATGTNGGSIAYINNLILNGCAISQPSGAVFNAGQKAVVDANGDIVTTEVVIATFYDLWVAGVHVTGANKDNILGDGKVTYDPTTKTLTLNNATINATTDDGIENDIPNLTINLIGENSISTADIGIVSDENFRITGTGSLTINADQIGIYHNYCNLTIENTAVTAIGNDWGICGQNGNNEILTITNSTVRATGTNGGSIRYINDLVLNGCAITQPTGAVFNAGQKEVVDANGDIVTTEVVIRPTYDLWVADVQVSDANKDDITSAVVAAGHTASGTITYNPTTNTLTFDNANISSSSDRVISNDIPNLTINLIGENTITAGDDGINLNKNTIITGTGSLTINAGYNGIYTEQCDLTIENTTVTANGQYYGIGGYYGNSGNLTITNSTVRATGTNQGSINNINNLVLNGCAIVQPEGAEFNASQYAVVDANGDIVTTEILIVPAYNLLVADVQVNDANKDNITAAIVAAGQTATGTITYDPTTNTLTLDNASINATYDGIRNQINNLTINLLGENTITANYEGIYSFQADFKITGTGSLTINAGYSGIYQKECDLTIENTIVTATGVYSGITGWFGATEVLTITNSTVRATGTNGGPIAYINNLVLNGCFISQPTGAIFDAGQKAVVDANGNIVTTEVVIRPTYELWVAGVRVNATNKDDILGNGKVTYDPTTGILTLDNATINATTDDGIENTIPNLTINLIGENSITASDYGIYSYEADFTIIGNGSLIINADHSGIYHNYCNLTIENTTVTAIGGGYGICGNSGNNEVLSITNSTVRATGTNGGSIAYINNLILNGCAITQPSGAYFDAEQYAVVDANGDIVTTEILIVPAYNLQVADVQINDANKDNITAAIVAAGQTATGTITYDPTTNTLTLDNASINATDDGIHNEIENLTINLLGENTISAGDDGIESDFSDFTITGSGSLTINAVFGIYQNNCNLAIDNTTITSIGQLYGICGYNGNNEVLSITNSTVRATGTNGGSIAYINNLVLNGCAILQPAGAVFNATQKAVVDANGDIVTTEVVIGHTYELWVAGVRVNATNKDDILGDGKVIYDPTTGILTLDNASINATDDGIHNEINNLTINLLGENTITANYEGIYSFQADFKITGTGSLTINAGYNGIYTEQCDLTIENTTVTANGQYYGIGGYYGNSGNLTITNSTVRATGTNGGSIAYINNLVLNGCAILQPAGAVFNATQKAVCYDYGNIVKGYEVVIEPGIAPTTYTVSGTVLDNENNPLANVEIAYNGGITTTAADGTYSFTAYENTTHTVTPSKFAYTFEPTTATVNVVDADVTGIDFVGTEGEIYDLYVAGVQITDANKDDITAAVVAAGVTASGSITYDPTTNTLTLDNANISAFGNGIENYIPNLRINLIGENTITANYDGIYSLQADFLITGTGSLTINANSLGIYHFECNLTIENTTVTVISNNWGICGNGYDEILTINNSTVKATGTDSGSIVDIYSLVLNGCAITQPSGAYFDAEQYAVVDANGDIVTTEVVIAPFPTISVSDATACDFYTLPTSENSDTWIWTNESNETVTEAIESGVYTVLATSEFDLTATENITVTINQSVTNEITEVACGSFEWNGTTYTNSGDYDQTFTAENGCDSVVTLHLTINQSVTNEITEVACGSFEWNGTTYDASGDYDQTFTAENGCDSIVTLHLTINESVTNEITEIACSSFEWNGTTYTETGDYSETFSAENGCDSIVTLHLTINQSVTNEITEIACSSFEWNGTTYTETGDYIETFTAENGCDSIVTLHLTINELPTVEITQEGEILTATAGMETYAWNTNETTESITISATGNYSVTVTNAEGCENTADIEVTEIPTTGINEIAVSKIAVYPNPNNGEFTINLGGIDNAISYQVIDAKGAIVKEAKVNSNEEFVSIQAKAGNYTVKVITDSKVFVEQIIVQ